MGAEEHPPGSNPDQVAEPPSVTGPVEGAVRSLTDPPERLAPGSRLGRYHVLALLGAGGMGEVYRARDTELEREVAVKVLPRALACDRSRVERFRREARALARLSHPGLLEIFDFGTEGTVAYAVTELLRGEDLRHRLAVGPLSWREAVELGAAVADAVAAAHREGVVHRDLKPENVFCVADGRVKVLDFGLARLAEPTSAEAETRSLEPGGTPTGVLVGTPGYLAPEQLRGRAADARTDVFALGCVLYETLTGERAFAGRSLADVLEKEPRPLREVGPEIPCEVEAVVRRCLAKRPEDRFPSAGEVSAALRSAAGRTVTRAARPPALRWRLPRLVVATAAVALVAALVAVGLLRNGQGADPSVQERAHRVVVATLENRTGDPELDLVGVMAADWLSDGLARVRTAEAVPGVVALGASRAVRAAVDEGRVANLVEALADATGAGLVVSGTVELLGGELQLRAQITDVEQSRVVVSLGPVSGPRGDPAVAVEALGGQVVGAVAYHLTSSVEVGLVARPLSFEAMREVMAGVELFGRDYEASIRHFRRALELNPEDPGCELWISGALANQGRLAEALAILRDLDTRRERLGPFERLSLDRARSSLEGRYLEALQASRAARRLAPRYWIGAYLHALDAINANRPGEAVEVLESFEPWPFRTPTPVDHFWDRVLLRALHQLGRYEEELEAARSSVETCPDVVHLRGAVARALVALGRPAEAERVVDEAMAVTPRQGPAIHVGTAGGVMLETATELRARGLLPESIRMAERAAAWYGGHRPADPGSQDLAGWRLQLADALELAGRLEECRAVLEEAAERPAEGSVRGLYQATVLGRLGSVAVREGEVEEARRLAARLEVMDDPFLYGEHLYQRARIAALLGQRDEGVRLVREAFAHGMEFSLSVLTDPALEPLRGEPGLEEVLRPKG